MKNRIVLLFIFTMFITVAAVYVTASPASAERFTTVSVETLKSKLGSDGLVIVDSRSGSDWRGSELIIPGAVRGKPGAEDLWAPEIPKNAEIIIYCA
nr:hypothetical protein [Maridesulfovibrio frigidus]